MSRKEAFEYSEAKFRELFEKSRDAFLIIENGSFVDYNQASLDMLGYKDKKELLGKHPAELSPEFQPDGRRSIEKAEELMEIALRDGSHCFEWVHVRANGEIFPLEISLTAITNEPGKQIIHTVWRDITEQKQRSQALIHAKQKAEESERLKSAFLANMSHEIRTPLNAILGFTGLLRDDELSHDRKEEFISIIESAGNQLMTIISDILDLSKLDAGQISLNKEVVNLNFFMEKLYKTNALGIVNNIELKVSRGLGDTECNVLTDMSRLGQIMDNLLSNARKHTREGYIEFGYTLEGNWLSFFVRDTGEGIPKKDHELIFKRFGQVLREERGYTKGTGLGLSICKGLVELFGGRIWVESEEGKGSVFQFTLPFEAYTQSGHQPERDLSFHAVELKGKTCLVAEDEDTNYFFLEALLKGTGMEVHRAGNGLEAKALFEENPDIDLVLMDIRLPEMNGLDATKALKKISPGVPVIAQTGYAMQEDIAKMREAGCDAVLIKPIDQKELFRTLGRFIDNEHRL